MNEASVWIGPFAAVAVLLAGAGIAKAVRPHATARALLDMGLPGRLPALSLLVRIGGMAEAGIGTAALLTAGSSLRVVAGVVAASYAGFASVVVLAITRGVPVGSCGCFGQPDTPPTVAHILVDVGAALTGLAVAWRPGGGLRGVFLHQPLAGVPLALLVGLAVYLAWVALTAVPRARAAAVVRGRRP